MQTRGHGLLSTGMGVSLRAFESKGRLAAVDVGYDARRDMCFAALVLWDVAANKPLGQWTRAAPSTFPYVPGLLSFREIPPLLPLLRRLRPDDFDLILVDGQGLAHPRRFGLACHLGVIYDKPSLGWAKSRLIGEYEEPEPHRGAATELGHRGDQIGWVLRSRDRCNPTFISPGHRVSLKGSLQLARALLGPCRLPEAARQAHRLTRLAMQN